MSKELTMSDFIRQHSEDCMMNALGAVRYTTWERNCPELTDTDFVNMGLQRCIMPVDSGRHFILNSKQQRNISCPHSTYFNSLHSRRRSDMLEAVSRESYRIVCTEAAEKGIDYLAHFPELNGYEIEAADGHFIKHACHTQKNEKGKVFAAGFIYAMNLRNGFLNPICKVTNGTKRSHEIPCFKEWVENDYKNQTPGRKLYIYDRASIDYNWWDNQKKKNVYMISIIKENAVTKFVRSLDFDQSDETNTGIISYELHSKGKKTFTVTTYRDPETKKVHKFISTLPESFRPGIIAILYYKRWTIEKAFNNSKSDLKETKGWSPETRALVAQMRLTTMAYNLMRLFEEISKKYDDDLVHPAEVKYEKTLQERQKKAASEDCFVNQIHFLTRIARISSFTIRTVQNAISGKNTFLWVMNELIDNLIPRQIRI